MKRHDIGKYTREHEGKYLVVNALARRVRALQSGQSVTFTPDGPRGPRMRAGDGVVSAARLSGAPVVPFAFSATRRRILGSWDRFLLPWPFGRGVIVWGAPIEVDRDADADERAAARERIEQSISAATERADRRAGHAPVPPDPALASAPALE